MIVCCRCRRRPEDIPDIRAWARALGTTALEYIRHEEGTYNSSTGLFACDECYIALGMPSAKPPKRWTPTRFYEEHERPGGGSQGIPGSRLRAFQDSLANKHIDQHLAQGKGD